ncbi:hypothetical protein AAHZ94_06215, partial [Streptomyces sp. HSW2009]|uniref:hypothetical protein n=1 Tax=Streptomyces sp. HSW2009 TaxID=3142890 RepID=UPI0032EF317B
AWGAPPGPPGPAPPPPLGGGRGGGGGGGGPGPVVPPLSRGRRCRPYGRRSAFVRTVNPHAQGPRPRSRRA